MGSLPKFADVNRWRTLFLLLMAVVSLDGFSQRDLVVVDVETMVPVVGANVVSHDGTSITDSLGHVMVSDSCQSLSFTHVNYESRIINVAELRRDTVFMISKLLNIKEVVVFGKGPLEELSFDMHYRCAVGSSKSQQRHSGVRDSEDAHPEEVACQHPQES